MRCNNKPNILKGESEKGESEKAERIVVFYDNNDENDKAKNDN